MPKAEAQIQKAILDYLAARRILAFRMQSGATLSSYKGKTRMVRYGVPGMADILAFYPTVYTFPDYQYFSIQPLWIECKAPKGKQTDLQKSFQQQVEGNNHKYIVARSIEDVVAAL